MDSKNIFGIILKGKCNLNGYFHSFLLFEVTYYVLFNISIIPLKFEMSEEFKKYLEGRKFQGQFQMK